MINLIRMKFFKTRKVISPTKSYTNDAGIDFFIPHEKNYHIRAGRDVLIPLGLKLKLTKDHCLLIVNRSSVAGKLKLLVGACLIDENYNGEIHAHLVNTADESIKLYRDQKIVQGIIIPVPTITMEQVFDENEIITESDRGEKGFGSSDKEVDF